LAARSILFLLSNAAALLAVGACARTEAVRTSANTMIVQASAAPACGALGATRVAQMSAAIETIKAGFDRYIIVGAEAQNNVVVSRGPGSYTTNGTLTSIGGNGVYRSTTSYNPGSTIVSGSRDQSFAIRMFKDGEAGSEQAISAREVLGKDWQERVESRTLTCL
jgi:hypothetical protein